MLALTTPLFRIRLADVDRGKREYDWDLPVEWLSHAFSDTDATPTAPGQLSIALSKNGTQVILHGHAKANVTMPCARTLEPVAVALDAEIILMLRPAPVALTTPRGTHVHSSKKQAQSSSHTGTQTQRLGGPGHRLVHRPESELTLEDAAEDFYQGEQLELDDFVREFLVLELPMMPLRSDLRFEERPAIPATPESRLGDHADAIDPRLRPLAEIASRLKKSTKE